jgi:hypothetical protein
MVRNDEIANLNLCKFALHCDGHVQNQAGIHILSGG